MKKIEERIWIVLIVLTIFAFLLGYLKLISSFLVAILLITTFIKGQLIIDYFMGLKNTQLKFRIIPMVWLVIILSCIAISYYLPARTI